MYASTFGGVAYRHGSAQFADKLMGQMTLNSHGIANGTVDVMLCLNADKCLYEVL